MSGRLYLLGAGLALVALGLAFTDWALSLQPGVTAPNARRIRPGMSLSEVEKILGRPADFEMTSPHGHGRRIVMYALWEAPTGNVRVHLDENARVELVEFTTQDETFLDRLRAWLGW
jgi:hypothetical protein